MAINIRKVDTTEIVGDEARKTYFLKVILQLLIGATYFFGILNLYFEKPLINILFNIGFGVVFTILYFLRKRNLELVILLGGLFYQCFIFGHSYFLLPGKQLEMGLGVLTAVLPIFVVGYRLWFFFISNFILYHIVLFSASYENIFHAQYGFYVVIFVLMNTILKENYQYERELIIQRDKIKQDATRLREVDELKTRFFANISHELRTPLTLVLAPMKNILQSNELSNRNSTYLRLMQQNGKKLLKRINELLELSRLDAQKLEINTSSVNIYQFTKQITATYEGAANLKGIQLNYVNEFEEDLKLLLDTPKLEMIISNYLSNALKFTPKGGVIKVNIFKSNNQLQVSVTDSGIGIPTDAIDQVFNRFYQVKGVAYQAGSGIGLALCKELAELHDGKVWVESTIGTGSTFFVSLPFIETYATIEIDKEEEIEILPIIKNTKKIAPKHHLPTVLVVEDNRDLRQYMELVLSENYNVILAENGQQALDILTEKGKQETDKNEQPSTVNRLPSIVISDIMMPVMDGLELLKNLKSSDEFRHLPVIMLTAQKHTNVKIEALRIGVDDYLTKPFETIELLARVENLIQNIQVRLAQNPQTNKKNIAIPIITTADMKWLKTIETKVLGNIDNAQFKLSDLAAEMNITMRTLQQKIKKITGKTPKAYQRDIVLHQAKKLLKSGEIKTVSELTYQLGFEDPHYFSKLYKKQFGLSPKEELNLLK